PIAFLGAIYAGLVPVPVNTLLTPGDYDFMLAHSRARSVVVSMALWPVVQTACAEAAASGRAPAVVVSGSGEVPAGSSPFARLLTASPLAAPADTRADDFAFWLVSSGSTGRPKGAVHTHANLYWTAALYGTPVLGLRESDVCFSAAKLFFAYGL